MPKIFNSYRRNDSATIAGHDGHKLQDPGEHAAQPLTGIRVLDLSGDVGVYCGKLRADVGADVIKVEPPGGDYMRQTGPFIRKVSDPENSIHWLHYNTNKRSIALDIESDAGSDLFLRLTENANVLLESFQPGYLDSLGVGYEHLGKANPGLVYASLIPFGQTGPYRGYLASDLVGFATGGYMTTPRKPGTTFGHGWTVKEWPAT